VSTAQKAIEARGVAPVRKPKAKEICPTCKQVVPHPRNYERHKALFGMLKPAFYYWPDPEVEPFRPNDAEHLRAWLLVKAGWRESEDLRISGTSSKYATIMAMAFLNRKREKTAVHFEEMKDGIRVYWPKSVAYTKCSEDQFRRVLTNVTEIVEEIIGVDVKTMRENYKRDVSEDIE
jgi:hypothetical protein